MNSGINLTTIKIQNFATFENQVINFSSGFNSIVGETGSGKSLILDALQLTFGSRADKKLVRKGSDFSTIETVFNCSSETTKSYFNDLGFPFDDEIIVKRVIYSTGKSKSFLNFQSCSLSILSQVTRKYIDLVGQFENQKLLSEQYQLKLLDNYSSTEDLLVKYTSKYEELSALKCKLIDLNNKKEQYNERKDFLKFQIKELEDLDPSEEDENSLKEIKHRILNAQNIKSTISEVTHLLTESDNSVQSLLSRIERLTTSTNLGSSISERISNIISEVSDTAYEVARQENEDTNGENLEDTLSLLDSYQKLKRKFNTDTSGLINIFQKYSKELSLMDNIDSQINLIHKTIGSISNECHEQAMTLHDLRSKSAKKLSKALTEKIHLLKMDGAEIRLEITKTEHLSSTGISKLYFNAQTNPGEGFYLIKEIASGGELSRILLAVRQVLSQTGSISVFLFDEIDTGIGGETALSIGKALQNVSRNSQVIAITHLAQIANQSDKLILVDKEQINKRTMSVITEVCKEEFAPHIKNMQSLS